MISLTYSDYQNSRKLSFSEVRCLANISKSKKNLIWLKNNDPNYRHDIALIAQNLTQIQQSVNSPSALVNTNSTNHSKHLTVKKIVSFIHKFIFIFTCTRYKNKALKKALPTLITLVAQARAAEDQTHTAAELKAESEIITKKLDLVNRAQQRFLQDNPDTAKWDHTAQEVNTYVQSKFKLLNFGINTALPDFYHSTRDNYFDWIVKSKKINQSNTGAQGQGVYISTNIEYVYYGPYALALDANAINSPATYTTSAFLSDSHNNMGKYNSIWICVKKDIPVNPSSVAHITVETLQERRSMTTRLKGLKFNVPVVTREASYRITDVFEKIVPSHQLSKQWTGAGVILPPNLTV